MFNQVKRTNNVNKTMTLVFNDSLKLDDNHTRHLNLHILIGTIPVTLIHYMSNLTQT